MSQLIRRHSSADLKIDIDYNGSFSHRPNSQPGAGETLAHYLLVLVVVWALWVLFQILVQSWHQITVAFARFL